MPKPVPTLLPVLQDVPKCREWAGGVGSQSRLSSADRAHMDAPPGFGLPAPGRRPAGLPAGCGRRLPDHLHGGRADHGHGARRRSATQRQLDCSSVLPDSLLTSLLVDGVWTRRRHRARLPAAGAAAVPVHRHPGRFRLPGARRADRRPHHGARRPAGQELHPAALGLRLRGAGHHGDAHHREQARPHRHHPDRAVHDLLGAPAGLHAADRGLHSEPQSARHP